MQVSAQLACAMLLGGVIWRLQTVRLPGYVAASIQLGSCVSDRPVHGRAWLSHAACQSLHAFSVGCTNFRMRDEKGSPEAIVLLALAVLYGYHVAMLTFGDAHHHHQGLLTAAAAVPVGATAVLPWQHPQPATVVA